MIAREEGKGGGRIWLVFICVTLLSFIYSFALAAERQGPFRASHIIDHLVKNDRGEGLGEVDDLIMSRNGKIKKVILSVGGFLGIGDRLVAVQYRSLRIDEKGDTIYNVTKEQLEKHPIFDYRKEGLFEYYYSPPPPYGALGLPPPHGGVLPPYGRPYAPFPRGRYRGEFGPWEWEYFPERLRIDAILNRAVLNDTGEEVGEVDDLLINREGKVKQIILRVGGFLGIDEKLVALPFVPLKMTDMGIVYNVTKQELKNQRAFSYEKK
jgi:sporulation protein YlmC with PRC-barrel domain